MTAKGPRLAVICVDGATPGYTNRFGLFRSRAGRPVAAVRSVYPSSTAPAHASILTGAPPATHGVVANRYWECESVAEIRRRQDPLSSLHPYDRASLRCPSFVDDLLGQGMTVGAVMFPHTFSRTLKHPAIESSYCLYAPARTWRVRLDGALTTEFFGERLTLSVTRAAPGAIRLGCLGQQWDLRPGDSADVVVAAGDEKAISFAMHLEAVDERQAVLRQRTAVLVLAAGAWPARQWVRGPALAHSRSVEYTANPAHDFHESPSVDWVTQSALRLVAEDPDVLFVRYNQVDHAQEYLYWQATRGDRDTAALASHQIETVYRRIAAQVDTLREAVGPECVVAVVSDHGIDYVATHVAPNRIIAEMGLDMEFVFQGDSNVCYLYGARSLTGRERTRFTRTAEAMGRGTLRVLSTAELAAWGVRCPPRCGVLALQSAAHAEFQYHDAALVEEVESASHGFDPRIPTMDGIWQLVQGPDLPAPESVTGVAGALRAALTRTGRR